MSTKQVFVLTDGSKFYDQEKNMVDLGAGKLKVYTNVNGAKSAARMIKSVALTPISLADAKETDDAKNGKATEVEVDWMTKVVEQGAKLTAKETSEEVLAAKETREFAEMLRVTYGHIAPDKAIQEKIHNFTLSPVGKRIDFNADYIRSLLAEYDTATEDTPVPANKRALLDNIQAQQAKMSKYRVAFADDPETLDDLLAGLKAKIAPLQVCLSELPDENKTIFDAVVLLPLCGKLFSEKALKPSVRGKTVDAPIWTDKLLALVYTSHREAVNGVKLNLDNASCFIYSRDHENVNSLNIPEGKLAVVSQEHILAGTIDEKQALGNIQAQALWLIAPDEGVGQARFIQAVASTGVDSFRSSKSTKLFKTAKIVAAAVIQDGQHSELEQAGNRSDTEKDHAPVVE